MPKQNQKLVHKLQIPVTEEDWLAFNRLLDEAILRGELKPRTTFAEYLRTILRKHLNENR